SDSLFVTKFPKYLKIFRNLQKAANTVCFPLLIITHAPIFRAGKDACGKSISSVPILCGWSKSIPSVPILIRV
ncbi:MAG: hypothetical protein WD600_02435, partial [Pseudohongiella sp.]